MHDVLAGMATLALVLAASLATTACSGRQTPEQQVRAVVAAAEDAAEVSRRLRGYLVTHPSIEVVTRIHAIEFPYEDLARVRLTIGTLGSDLRSLDVSADAQDVELELQREGGDWRITRAAWD